MITTIKTRRIAEFKDPERSFGRESRSLKACYDLMKAGFSNVTHLEDGVAGWRVAGKEME